MLQVPETPSGVELKNNEVQLRGTWGIGLAVKSPSEAFVFRYQPDPQKDLEEHYNKKVSSGKVLKIVDPEVIKNL